jgi:antibiotic biosynthesis monooxygenase (ABM) superfamily enzyme
MMFARIATFEGVNMEAAERTMEEAQRRVETLMRAMPGYRGYLELVDRTGGRAQTIALFDTEENMMAAEQTFDEEMPKQLADLFDQWEGRRTSVDRYEVVAEQRI